MDITSHLPRTDKTLPKIWIRSYYKSFDGLRGLAVGLVFLTHIGDPLLGSKIASKLWVGVELFFVLSGFLITGILFDARDTPHFFSNFYVRRALRIFPIFYGFFLLLLLLTPVLHLRYDMSLFSFAFYLGNLVAPFVDVVHHSPFGITGTLHGYAFRSNIGHFWSLCVEEQFYLTWPLLIYFVRSRTALIRICVCGCVGIPILRIALVAVSHWHGHLSPMVFYWLPITRVDTLLWGSMAALWLRHRALSINEIRIGSAALMGVPVLLMMLLGRYPWMDYTLDSLFMRSIGYTMVALVSLGLVVASLDDDFFIARCLRFRPLAYLGTISYGFYLFHGILLDPIKALTSGIFSGRWAWMVTFTVFAVTLALAWLSFRFFESPFLRLKSRLAPQVTASEHGRVALHVPQPQPAES